MSTSSGDSGVGQADIGKDSEQNDAISDDASLKSWRTLLEASSNRSRKIRGSNYVQIATTDPETNEPRCRTVVFRGFQKLPEDHPFSNTLDGLPCVMRMITDDRSKKVQESTNTKAEKNNAEIVWWFPKTSEQYRIRGKLLFVGNGKFPMDSDRDLTIARKEQWGNLSDAARESMFDQNLPGAPYTGVPKDVPKAGRDEDGKVLPPPDNYLLMLLSPTFCDYVRLTDMYRQEDEFKDGTWISTRLNP